MKICLTCKEPKSLDLFYKKSGGRSGVAAHCVPCHNLRSQKYRDADPKQYRKSRLLRLYGINEAQYNWLLASQGGVCKICFKTEEQNGRMLSVDHSHETGDVRGIICDGCNKALGCMQDSSWALRAAADYLDQSVARWD